MNHIFHEMSYVLWCPQNSHHLAKFMTACKVHFSTVLGFIFLTV